MNTNLTRWEQTASPYLLSKVEKKKKRKQKKLTPHQRSELRKTNRRILLEKRQRRKANKIPKKKVISLKILKRKNPKTSYEQFLDSPIWEARRELFYRTHSKRCSKCGCASNIHLHHIVYSVWGEEKDEHLTPLCETHHKEFHDTYGTQKDMTENVRLFLSVDNRVDF